MNLKKGKMEMDGMCRNEVESILHSETPGSQTTQELIELNCLEVEKPREQKHPRGEIRPPRTMGTTTDHL